MKYELKQRELAKSAQAENERRRAAYEKNLAAHAERMMDLQSVLGHLSKPRPKDVEPYFENKLPKPKSRERACEDFFTCNIWDVEPLLLDELSAARASGDQARIDEIRQIIRAASWMKHERTDENVAVQMTREKTELFQHDHATRHAMMTEIGFKREAAKIDPDLIGTKTVLEAIDGFAAIGNDAEPALRYVEGAIEQDWDAFLVALEKEKAPWPENPGVKLEGNAADLMERIKAWRMIRDQLVYQRYYENLSKIGRLHSKSKNPFNASKRR